MLIRRYVKKFGCEVLIDDTHPLAQEDSAPHVPATPPPAAPPATAPPLSLTMATARTSRRGR